MFWWTKKYWEIRLLKDSVNTLGERIDRANAKINKLERIIKNSKDEPSYNIEYHAWNDNHKQECTFLPKLYLYIDKDEYVIELNNLLTTISYSDHNNKIELKHCELKVEGDLAYFDCKCQRNGKWILHHYVIDYKRNAYVCAEEVLL